MKFEYFRFLLTPVKDPQLPFIKETSREEILNEIFSKGKTYLFNSGRAKFGLTIDSLQNGLVMARIGKQTTKSLRASPDEGFAVKKVEDWPGSIIFINLNDEKSSGQLKSSGQVVAFSVNPAAISNPKNCLYALAEKINGVIVHKGYYLTINPIPTERKKFWAVANEHKGQIKKVVLTYTPPNLFDIGTTLENDLREANNTFNTTSTQIVLENESGNLELPETNKLLQETAEWIDLGGGSYKFHLSKGKKTISSENGVKTETFDGLELTLDTNNGNEILSAIRAVLGLSNG